MKPLTIKGSELFSGKPKPTTSDKKTEEKDDTPDTSTEEGNEQETENEDDTTSEDEGTEENEDVEEGDDDSGSDTDEEEDSSQDEDEEDTQLTDDEIKTVRQHLMDPKSVPEELRPHFNYLNKKFTTKMQQASEVIKKAESFDRLLGDEDFRAYLQGRQKDITFSSLINSKSRGTGKTEENGEDDEDAPVTLGSLKKMMGDLIDSRLDAKMRPLEEERQNTRQAQIQREVTKFKKENPQWILYRDELESLLNKYPNMPLDEALAHAESNDPDRALRNKINKKKGNANVRKPSNNQAQTRGEENPKIKSIADAFNFAKKQLARSARSRR